MHPSRLLALTFARGELGAGRVHVYWKEVLRGAPPPYPPAWCGAFVLWCLRGAEITDVSWEVGHGFLSMLDEQKKRVWRLPRVTRPEPGDVAYFDKPFQHHAIVERFEEAPSVEQNGFVHKAWSLVTIDGNQPDVRRRYREHTPSMRPSAVFFSIEPWLKLKECP